MGQGLMAQRVKGQRVKKGQVIVKLAVDDRQARLDEAQALVRHRQMDFEAGRQLTEKGFRPEDFASLHPGGKLGKRLMRVEQLMHAGEALPVVQLHTAMKDVIYEMSRKGLGMTSVVEKDGRLAGIITDGDLRRKWSAASVQDLTARDVMSVNPVTIPHDTMAVEALAMMEQRKITSFVVIDADHRVEGVVHLHDLWRTEMV